MAQQNILTSLLDTMDVKPSSSLGKFTKIFINGCDSQSHIKDFNPEILAHIVKTHHGLEQKFKGDKPVISIRSVKRDDGKTKGTLIDIVSKDMSFIVDSVTAEMSDRGYTIETLIHPYTKDKVSHIHIRLENTLAQAEQKNLEQKFRQILKDIAYANEDFSMMKTVLRKCQNALSYAPANKYSDIEIEESLEFLEYLYQDNFTLLGYREFSFSDKNGKTSSRTVANSSLGLLRNERSPIFVNKKDISLPDHLQKKRKSLPAVYVSKVNRDSTVHRKVPLDCVAIKLFNKDGTLKGEGIFIGLFTSVTYSRSLRSIPYLRLKANAVLSKSGFEPGTHDYRALRHILEKYPRDELFQIEVEQLTEFTRDIMNLYEHRKVALFVRKDLFGRYVSCLVYVPRDRFETRLRLKFKDILEETFKGEMLNYHLIIDDSPIARVLYTISIEPFKPLRYNHEATQKQLREAAQSWPMQLFDEVLAITKDDSRALEIREKYGHAFSPDYQLSTPLGQTYKDIQKIEELDKGDNLIFDLVIPEDTQSGHIRLNAYHRETPLPLSRIFPVIENMGLQIDSEFPSKVTLANGETYWIHNFDMWFENKENLPSDYSRIKNLFEEALVQVMNGRYEDDRFNQLILKAAMPARSISLLRGYLRYIRQTKFPFSKTFTENVLAKFPAVSQLLVNLFDTLHNPKIATKDRNGLVKDIQKALDKEMQKVVSFDHDQILRLFQTVIQSTLRTNFYQKQANGEDKNYISFKLESAKIPTLPKPFPYREIFVYSRHTEGIHLRGDEIARGGIRWSDRHEDFRTEVLGLMKAQQVKNAIIVPMGAKGGFIVKNPPKHGGREALYKEGIECYKTFISGLLDITDNYRGTKLVRPANVVCHDDPDPYLVVAADKGTASFSDIANGLSAEYDFWLKDAFASGGSAGYDHKVMGITARGAWESVKRHFREMDFDTQTQDFDVIGVGDMGGDVFGNGMLLSEHIRLIGAFNHLHIFCDPDPDPAKSFKERKRLFEEVKGWDHYNEKLLSKGGKIFSRSDKSLKLTPEIKKAFGITENTISPNELMTAMLKAQTDLLWFGGIGTYIKASAQSHAEVGDKANDAIRINAPEVKAKVIGEGANLAITQDARVEYARHGGRINADFIDNSGGVDSSDHEVNIKILLNKIIDSTALSLSLKARNKLLESMTEEVAQLVLRNNYQQAQAISLVEKRAAEALDEHAEFMRDLEADGKLDRRVENLPGDPEIESRLAQGVGLTRPEIAILSCYAKITLTKTLLKTKISNLDIAEKWVLSYFPQALQQKYKKEILKHRLHDEIFCTMLASTMVNRLGPVFVHRIAKNTAKPIEKVVKAFLVIFDVFSLRELWDKIEAQDGKVPAELQLNALQKIADTTERMIAWFLERYPNEVRPEKDIDYFKPLVTELKSCLMEVMPTYRKEQIEQKIADNQDSAFPKDLAYDLALLSPMSASFDIALLAKDTKLTAIDAARVYYTIGTYYDLYWLREQAKKLSLDTPWEAEALEKIRDRLYRAQASISRSFLRKQKNKKVTINEKTLHEWCTADDNCHLSDKVRTEILNMKKSETVTLPMLFVAVESLRDLHD